MITNNVIQRVFHISVGDNHGTAFALDHLEKQYLVTARHVLGNSALESISIFHGDRWKQMPVNIVGIGDGDGDIAVLAPCSQLAPTLPLEATTKGIIVGQRVYFLGFPLGMMGRADKINNNFPIPLVKSGVLSGLRGTPLWELLVDGHNNPGFSGGPLVFSPPGEHEFRVAGVITAYPLAFLPIYDVQGRQIGSIPENSGIVIGHSIQFAIDLIDKNPIGFALPK